jgi:hypothetical protein
MALFKERREGAFKHQTDFVLAWSQSGFSAQNMLYRKKRSPKPLPVRAACCSRLLGQARCLLGDRHCRRELHPPPQKGNPSPRIPTGRPGLRETLWAWTQTWTHELSRAQRKQTQPVHDCLCRALVLKLSGLALSPLTQTGICKSLPAIWMRSITLICQYCFPWRNI